MSQAKELVKSESVNKESDLNQVANLPNAPVAVPKNESNAKFTPEKKIEIPKDVPTNRASISPASKTPRANPPTKNQSSFQLVMRFMTPLEAKNYVLENGKKELEDQAKEADQLRNQTYDPWAQLRKPDFFRLTKRTWGLIGIIPIFTWILLLFCFAMDKATERVSGNFYNVYDLINSCFNPDVDQGRSIVEAILNTMSVIFGLLITVIGIILQLSANRFTSHVTSLFFRDISIGLFLSYVVFCNAFCFWVYLSIGPLYVPRASVLLSLLLVTSQLTLLFPFLAYLFYFLEPDKIMNNGITAASESVNQHGLDIDKQQVKATLAVEHLMDAANSAVKKKDKNITAEIVDALCSFYIAYGFYKSTHKMHTFWFKVPPWIRQSPDFLALTDDSIQDIIDRKTWMEWKILRQYQMLFNESLKFMKELCYHIAMNTRMAGEDCARAAFNGNDIRTVYNVLYQYRSLCQFVIQYGSQVAEQGATEENGLELRAIRIAKFMRYYSFLFLGQKQLFLVETITHDLRSLCETALQFNSIIHDKLLTIFLTVDDGADATEGKVAIVGVRKAQVILATHYLVQGRREYAQRIQQDMAEDLHKSLWGLMQELLNITNREFWEVSERGTNFTFLTAEQKAQLPNFFQMFKNFQSDQIPLNAQERKKFQRQHELLNFD